MLTVQIHSITFWPFPPFFPTPTWSAVLNVLAPLSRLALLATALTAAGTAAAASDFAPYVGGGAGVSRFGYDSEQCTADAGLPCQVDQSDTGFKIFGGIKLNASQGLVEVAYYDFGTLTGDVSGLVTLEETETAFALSMGVTPVLTEGVEGLLRFGLYGADLEATATGPGGSYTATDSTSGLMLGAGATIAFNDNAALRIEYEHFLDAGDVDTDLGIATASLVFSF